tara:strand:- start:175 stop:369 length:195 start_codon:yes stop_codon:yes gene_type:complete
MSKLDNFSIPGLAIAGVSGVFVGAAVAIGFGMGRSFGRMACDRLDILEDKLAAVWINRMPQGME